MKPASANHQSTPASRNELPVLSGLGLTEDESAALHRQGFVRREQRGSKIVYRLRYRLDGRQKSRYLSAPDAAAVEAELAQLQNTVRHRRTLAAVSRLARQRLRERKQRLAPLLAARGCYFHGHDVRQRHVVTET